MNTTHSRVRRISVMGVSLLRKTGEQARPLPRHGIEPTVAPRVAAQDATPRQIRARGRAVALQRIERIGRTAGFEPAGIAQPGLEQQRYARTERSTPIAAVGQTSRASRRVLLRLLSIAGALQQIFKLLSRDSAQLARRGGDEAPAIERRSQPHQPQAARQAGLVLPHRGANLPLERLRVAASRACRFGTATPKPAARGCAGAATHPQPVRKSLDWLWTTCRSLASCRLSTARRGDRLHGVRRSERFGLWRASPTRGRSRPSAGCGRACPNACRLRPTGACGPWRGAH